jgi:hypothetical protein
VRRWLLLCVFLLLLSGGRPAQAVPSLLNVQFTATDCVCNPDYSIAWRTCKAACPQPLVSFCPNICGANAKAFSFLGACPQPGTCLPISRCRCNSSITWSYQVAICGPTCVNFLVTSACGCRPACVNTPICCCGLCAKFCCDFVCAGCFVLHPCQGGSVIFPLTFEGVEPLFSVTVTPVLAPEVDPRSASTGLALALATLLIVERRRRA